MSTEILITGDGSPTLSISDTGETYHSKHGALAESMHIFIENGLCFARQSGAKTIRLFELGFGTGLNAALTLLKSVEWGQNIIYHSLELFPPSAELIRSCAEYYSPEIRDALLEVNKTNWNEPASIGSFFTLRKEKTDFLEWEPKQQYDLVYFDAFAPSTAPQLWTVSCFTKLASVMPAGGALVTFCAKGEVKRAMRDAGFRVERLPGAPGKREMTRAIKL